MENDPLILDVIELAESIFEQYVVDKEESLIKKNISQKLLQQKQDINGKQI